MITILRLSILLNRDRVDEEIPMLDISAELEKLTIKFPQSWLDEYPLTRIDLEQEFVYLKAINIELCFA